MLFLIPIDDNDERWKWLLDQFGSKEMRIFYHEAYSILQNKEDAYDVLYEALLKGFSKCHQLRDENKVFYWMLQIVRNEAYTYYKHFSLHTLWTQAKLALIKPAYNDSAEYLVIQEQENERLQKELEKLKYPDKDIIRMRVFEGKGFPEIANQLNMNYHTVRSQYQRLLRKLKCALEDKGNEKA